MTYLAFVLEWYTKPMMMSIAVKVKETVLRINLENPTQSFYIIKFCT